MLNTLHVKNLALIDEAEIEFSDGLNILTGETGAGKSVIIGSIMLALGGKGDKDLIRAGKEYALIELTFHIDRQSQLDKLRAMDFEAEDGEVLITRKITPQKSVFKINGETVTARQIKELSGVLIDIYGQNEHQSLVKRSSQLRLLDEYLGEDAKKLLAEIALLYQQHNSLGREYSAMNMDENTRNREISLCEYELNEILEAGFNEGEDEELENEYRRMQNSQKIAERCGIAWEIMTGSDNDNASSLISRALREVKEASDYDQTLESIYESLASIDDILAGASRELSGYIDNLEFSPEKFAEVESRLNIINGLKSKYGDSFSKITRYRLELEEKLQAFENYNEKKAQLERALNDNKHELLKTCKQMSELRREGAKNLSKKLSEVLMELNFLQVEFEISVTADEESLSASGYDDVSYLISTNPGERPKPIENIASGGELSRIMLGLKTVLADSDDMDTFIFDEIDTGISGQTAWKVARRMRSISQGHQVLCITHLPQIAAGADTHFKIEKSADEGHTHTEIYPLSEDDSIMEIARMSGGDTITELTLAGASEMKQKARS